MLRDLALSLDQDRLAQHPQDFGAVLEHHLADAQPWRLLAENIRDTRGRNLPDLDGDRASALPTQHRRMPIVDRPQTIYRGGARLAHERRAGGDEIAVELEPAHQRAVHGQQHRYTCDRVGARELRWHAARWSASVAASTGISR